MNLKRFRKDLLEWSEGNLRSFAWRDEEVSLYEVLMAEVFLSVTRADVVAGVYEQFMERYPDPETLAGADRDELVEVIRPLGLYNRRADALLEIADRIVQDGFPEEREELMDLPRVGDYVANAVLCIGLGEDLPMLDRNVARVISRVSRFDIDEDSPRAEDWELAENLVPAGDAERFNLALLDFASAVCTASNPSCGDCFASGYCLFVSERGHGGSPQAHDPKTD